MGKGARGGASSGRSGARSGTECAGDCTPKFMAFVICGFIALGVAIGLIIYYTASPAPGAAKGRGGNKGWGG